MEAEKITLADGSTASLATTHALTDKSMPSTKVVPISVKKPVVFFIGGAADQKKYYTEGPNGNINYARNLFTNRITKAQISESKYIVITKGYDDAKGEDDIKEHFISHIPSKESPIYIIGHSLGGWNGAHLSRLLSEQGYKIKILVTLDPVGKGILVWLGSDIYMKEPSPVAEQWINVLAKPERPDDSDGVAKMGERWVIKNGPTFNKSANRNHAAADGLFIDRIFDNKSACDLVFDSFIENIAP
ncbi:alpha/beta hydrolase [Pseudomonas sp. NPDC089406]|uniref:alpha/beta hydrolase n=1 Tax=Pseudomonas sp. NPDC089406 TaxID=3364463 RepID=UPI00384F7822